MREILNTKKKKYCAAFVVSLNIFTFRASNSSSGGNKVQG